MDRPPLSQRLKQILETNSSTATFTLNDLMVHTHGRGLYLVMILLCLPFITPVPLPLVSSLVGVIIVWLSMRLALELPPRLPKFLGARTLPVQRQEKILRSSLKFLEFIEKMAKPRGSSWLTLRAARCGNALVLALMGILLALPFPPLVFFTNSLPSYAIILIAASMMEEDGRLIWFGYATALISLVYVVLIGVGSVALFTRYYERFLHFIQSWL